MSALAREAALLDRSIVPWEVEHDGRYYLVFFGSCLIFFVCFPFGRPAERLGAFYEVMTMDERKGGR